jgi:indolepyruvate ferredoxin oxidoreductase beta subunit
MSQRGGAVSSHLRVSDKPIHSDLVPRGKGTLVLAVEPLESLRYVEYLSPEGALVAGTDPFINIADYGDVEPILDAIAAVPSHTLIPSDRVMLGAASPYLGLPDELLEDGIREAFARKGEKVQDINVAAFRAGKAAGQAYRSLIQAGVRSKEARALVGRLTQGVLSNDALEPWKKVLTSPLAPAIDELLEGKTLGQVHGTPDVPKRVLDTADAKDRLSELLFQA